MTVWSSPLLIVTMLGSLWSFYDRVETLETNFTEHLERSETQFKTFILGELEEDKKLDRLLNNDEKRTRREMTIKGQGQAGDFGGTSSYVQINEDLFTYLEEKEVKITNLDSQTSRVFTIDGTFKGPASRLVRFSRVAADQLEVVGSVPIRLEPVMPVMTEESDSATLQ